jgi:hypothetical protein
MTRVFSAWRALAADQRLAAMAAIGLFLSMFLPWYVETVVFTSGNGSIHPQNQSAFQSFSFVEAAVLLVAGGVLYLLFARAEDRAFHLPGGDGVVIMVAGVWAGLLIFYRLLDTPATSHNGPRLVNSVGLKWGIFIALAAAIGLAVAGSRVRSAHHPEPELEVPIRPRPSAGPPVPPGAPFGQQGAAPVAADPPTARTRRLPTAPNPNQPLPFDQPATPAARDARRDEPLDGQLSLEDSERERERD